MAGLSKSRIISHNQCPKRLWLQVFDPGKATPTTATQMRMNAGHDVGAIAQKLHPDGVLIDVTDLKQAVIDTTAALQGTPRPIYEATFQTDGVLISADLLLPAGGGTYKLVEVKSSTQVKDYHLQDVAIQSWVAQKAGLQLVATEVAHIDTQFRYPGNGQYQGLLNHADVSAEIAPLQESVSGWVHTARQTLDGAMPTVAPNLKPGGHCKLPFDCPFIPFCAPQPDASPDVYPVTIFPRSGKFTAELEAEGFTDLRTVPFDRLRNAIQQRIWRTTTSGMFELDALATKTVRELSYPRYYLDFESIQLVVPIYTGTWPYQQLTFQWSCHVEEAPGVFTHLEFLADGLSDPRPGFAESLADAIGPAGPIVVYNAGFEGARLKELAEDFPQHSAKLMNIRSRLFDLLPLARRHYYHPAMRGSWSIKAVLPSIAPDLAYEDLTVQNGGMAMEVYAKLMDPQTSTAARSSLRAGLLEYCKRDTWAMVRVAQFFANPSQATEGFWMLSRSRSASRAS